MSSLYLQVHLSSGTCLEPISGPRGNAGNWLMDQAELIIFKSQRSMGGFGDNAGMLWVDFHPPVMWHSVLRPSFLCLSQESSQPKSLG